MNASASMHDRLHSLVSSAMWVVLPLLSCVLASNPARAADCPDALFTCETNRAGKYAQICATEVKVGEIWKDVYYRFGAEGVKPELVYPATAVPAKRVFFFSHTVVGSDYRVSVRFVSGDYTYRVYSNSGQGNAGVLVSDSKGNVISNAKCIERPYMFPSYLQRALACDMETEYGAAACADKPLHVPK